MANCNDVRAKIDEIVALKKNEIDHLKVLLLGRLNEYESERIQRASARDKFLRVQKKSMSFPNNFISTPYESDDEESVDSFYPFEELLTFNGDLQKIDSKFLGKFEVRYMSQSIYYDPGNFSKVSLSKLFSLDLPFDEHDFEIEIEDDAYYCIYRDQELKCKFMYWNGASGYVSSLSLPRSCSFINFRQRKGFVVLNYIHEQTSDYYLRVIKIHEDSKCVDKKNFLNAYDCDLGNLVLIGADESNIYCSSNNSLHLFDWNLELIKSFPQTDQFDMPFYFPFNIKQIELKNEKYYWLDDTGLNIKSAIDGNIMKSIRLKADKFVFNSNDCLIAFSKLRQIVWFFCSENGDLLSQCKLQQFPLPIASLFVNKYDKLCFLDKSNLELNILKPDIGFKDELEF